MRGKKGFVFTLIAIVLSLVLLFSVSLENDLYFKERSDVVAFRVHTVNDFIVDVENDLKKGITITTARTLLGIQEHITEQGEFISNISSAFEEGFLNGTVASSPAGLLNDSTFVNWTTRIQQQAERTDIEVNFTVGNISIAHQTPWKVNVTVQLGMIVVDKKRTASWKRTAEVSSLLDITDFEDPLYLVNTLGKATNTIRISNSTPFTTGFDTTNLMIHTNESTYINSSSAPSYLKRMMGDTTASPHGIESLVNIVYLQSQGVSTESKTIVDHIYFSNSNPSTNVINNTPSWFRLDDNHLQVYQVEDLVIS